MYKRLDKFWAKCGFRGNFRKCVDLISYKFIKYKYKYENI
jgi:hypothetical protein